MSGPSLEAEVVLFYGPRVQISAFFIQRLEDGMFVAGEDRVTDQRLMAMLHGRLRRPGRAGITCRGGSLPFNGLLHGHMVWAWTEGLLRGQAARLTRPAS